MSYTILIRILHAYDTNFIIFSIKNSCSIYMGDRGITIHTINEVKFNCKNIFRDIGG